MAKLPGYASDYPEHKRAHTRALRAPMVCPMMGDGDGAQRASTPLRYASFNMRRALSQPEMRDRLVAARYNDWLAARAAGEGE
jgi:hypothetical protein